jgi:hypothetical protein
VGSLGPEARAIVARVLAAAACLAAALALVAGYVQHAATDSDQFANRATEALRDDSVRSLVATTITDEVVLKQQRDLIAARPIIESVASAIVGGRAFTGLFRAGVRDVHRAVFDRDRNTVTLTVADVGTVLAAAVRKLRPELADELESSGAVELLERDVGETTGGLVRTADEVRLLAVLLLVAAVVLGAAALAVSPDRRRTVVHLGAGLAAGGVLLVVAWSVLRSVAIEQIEAPEGRDAAGAVWDAFLGDLRSAAWLLAAGGAVVAAATASVIRPVELGEPLRRAGRRLAAEPRHPALRALRAGALVAAGLLLLLQPGAVLQLVLAVAGTYLVYEGVNAILRLTYRPEAATERPRPPGRRWSRFAAPALAVVLVAGLTAIFLGSGTTTTAAPPTGDCNGHAELCDRPLDEVVLPATHNAMSVPLPGWYSALQEAPIADQLADGVRGLLIDTHYADRLPNGRLRTDFEKEGSRRAAAEDGVGSEALDAAMRIRDRLGFAGEGEPGMYLCHSFCELGGTPLASVLDDIRDFLVANPGEVLVIVNQDYLTPEDFVGAVSDAGLADLAITPPAAGAPWPTLGELVERGKRVLFLAENGAGAAPWYRPVYEGITEETPYGFRRPAQLTRATKLAASCEPNRGRPGSPLFLINHWITTDPLGKPSNAAKVNAYEPLLRRVRECREVRDHLPSLLAVDFYREGDLFRVADRLNGVD